MTAVSVATISMMSGRLGQTLTPGLKLPRLFIYIAVPICTLLLGIEIVRRFLDKDYS
jgi:TRAP-type C4-dicarboxylate transport system permease small subunit